MKKEELKEYKELVKLSGIWCSEALSVLKKHKEKAWERCNPQQLVEFLSQLTSDDFLCNTSNPCSSKLIGYYRRSLISIDLAIAEMLVDAYKLHCPAWYELVNAANAAADSGNRKDVTRLKSKIKQFREKTDIFLNDDEPTLGVWLNTLDDDAYSDYDVYVEDYQIDDVIALLALIKYQKGSPQQRMDKAEKAVADRIRQVVDPPTIRDLRAVVEEMRQ